MELLATGRCIHAGTMNAQNSSVAAALSTLQELERDSQRTYGRLFRLGQDLRQKLEVAADEHCHDILTQGLGPVFHLGFTSVEKVKDYRGTLNYDKAKYRRFCQGMRERGIRLIGRGVWYISAAHTQEDIERCAGAACETFAEMSEKRWNSTNRR